MERRASVRMRSPRAKKEAAVVGAGAGIGRNRKLDLLFASLSDPSLSSAQLTNP